MADGEKILIDFTTGISEAIKQKKGYPSSTKINPQNFDEEILSISTDPTLQSKTAIPTGTQQTILPDSGYDGLSSVTIKAIPTETTEVELSLKDGNQTVSPSTGKFFSQVTIKKPDELVPDNIVKNVTIAGVTGNFEGTDTSDANATANDLLSGKTAYAKSGKIIGTIRTYDGSYTNLEGYTVIVNAEIQGGLPFYDGTDESGIKYMLASGENILNITSGYGYIIGEDPRISGPKYIEDKPTVSGGVSIENWVDYNYSTGSGGAALFKVVGDGTVTVEIWCMIEGTQITLADGSKKAIENIAYDDELLVWNFYEGKFDKAKPVWIKPEEITDEYCLVEFSNGAEVGFVGPGEQMRETDGGRGYHRIFNKEAGAFTYVGTEETPIGTETFADDNSFPTVVSQKIIKEKVKFYNIITDKHFNIFANGILTSCRLSNMYRIENMKYVGERLIKEEQVSAYFEKLENNKAEVVL